MKKRTCQVCGRGGKNWGELQIYETPVGRLCAAHVTVVLSHIIEKLCAQGTSAAAEIIKDTLRRSNVALALSYARKERAANREIREIMENTEDGWLTKEDRAEIARHEEIACWAGINKKYALHAWRSEAQA
jgi:hypothetical protein